MTGFLFTIETNDTIFSIFSGEVGSWEVKYENMCVDEGCYIIAMSSDYWYDGSGLSLSYPGYTYSNYFNNYEASYDFLSVGDMTCMGMDQIYRLY